MIFRKNKKNWFTKKGKKKEIIRIIRKDSNKEDYTFINYNILNNVNNIKDGKSAITNNEKKVWV